MGNRINRPSTVDYRLSTQTKVICVFVSLWSMVYSPWSCDAAERIVSLNACTDELLLQLANPEQIAGVTSFDHSPQSQEVLRRFPSILKLTTDVESIIKAQPTLVLAGPFSNPLLIEQLKKMNVSVEMLSVPRNWAELSAVAGAIAKAANVPNHLEDFQNKIQDLQTHSKTSPWKGTRAVFWSAAGHVSGKNTFEDTILSTLGMENVISFEGYDFLSVEKLILLKPEVVVVTQDFSLKNSWSHETLFHPALKKALPEMQYLHIPEEAVSCASGYTIEVLRNLLMGSVPSLARE